MPIKEEGLYFYEIAPMDFGWDKFPITTEYIKSLVDEFAELDFANGLSNTIASFQNFTERALAIGRRNGWEGDFRSGTTPHVVILPNEDAPKIGLVWKQDNNGTTFVVSQVEMPWLEQ